MSKTKQPEGELIGDVPVEQVSSSSIDKLTEAIHALVALQMSRPQQAQDGNSEALMTTLTEALNRVSDNQMAGAKLIADTTRQVHRPSNVVVPMRSVFDLRGNAALHPDGSHYVKPVLRCDCWCPRPETVNDNMLTREEVELLNLLMDAPGNYVIRRNDDTKIKMTVKTDRALDEITPSKCVITHETGYNSEYFRLIPSLHSQLRQMLAQVADEKLKSAARAVLTMEEEEALVRAGKLSVAA